jgi:hypothetical protein
MACDRAYVQQIERYIKNFNKRIERLNRKIDKIEGKRLSAVSKVQVELDGVQTQKDTANNNINSRKTRDLNAANAYFDNMIRRANEEFAPKLDRLSDECARRDAAFNTGIQPLLTKITNSIAYKAQLLALANSATDSNTKFNYERQARDVQVTIDRFQKDEADSRRIHAERMRGCSSSNKGSLGDQLSQAIAYWNKKRAESIKIIEDRYKNFNDNNTKNIVLNRRMDNIQARIDRISNNYDARKSIIQQHVAYWQQQIGTWQSILNNCNDVPSD